MKDQEESENLKEEFENVVSAAESVDLEKPPTNYALEIVSSRDSESPAAITHYDELVDGNLKPLNKIMIAMFSRYMQFYPNKIRSSR